MSQIFAPSLTGTATSVGVGKPLSVRSQDLLKRLLAKAGPGKPLDPKKVLEVSKKTGLTVDEV